MRTLGSRFQRNMGDRAITQDPAWTESAIRSGYETPIDWNMAGAFGWGQGLRNETAARNNLFSQALTSGPYGGGQGGILRSFPRMQ